MGVYGAAAGRDVVIVVIIYKRIVYSQDMVLHTHTHTCKSAIINNHKINMNIHTATCNCTMKYA